MRFGTRPKRQSPRPTAGLRQARRAANRKQARGDRRRECGQSGCGAAIPAHALAPRRARGGLYAFPGHQGLDVVVAAGVRVLESCELRDADSGVQREDGHGIASVDATLRRRIQAAPISVQVMIAAKNPVQHPLLATIATERSATTRRTCAGLPTALPRSEHTTASTRTSRRCSVRPPGPEAAWARDLDHLSRAHAETEMTNRLRVLVANERGPRPARRRRDDRRRRRP